jgi:serine/threonine protein phosphatase PrpC
LHLSTKPSEPLYPDHFLPRSVEYIITSNLQSYSHQLSVIMGNTSSEAAGCAKNPAFEKTTQKGHSKEQNLEYAVSSMQGKRPSMEDKHLYCVELPVHGKIPTFLVDHAIFAVFDGHGGPFSSTYVEEHFLQVLSRRPELARYADMPPTGSKSRADANGIMLLKQALVSTFLMLDEMLIPMQKQRNAAISSGELTPPPLAAESDSEDENTAGTDSGIPLKLNGERSGSTCVAVLLTPTHFVCANTGDSRAILRRNGKILPLSFDHKPVEVGERARITSAGGVVKGKRIDGDLAVSRGFGDYMYKKDPGLAPDLQKVTVVPDLVVYPRDQAFDEFILLACDGVWDVASNTQCADIVQKLLTEGETDLGNICEEALDTCLDRHSGDNMTVMLVGLPAMNVNRSGIAILSNALWGTRTARKVRLLTNATTKATGTALDTVRKEIKNHIRPSTPNTLQTK